MHKVFIGLCLLEQFLLGWCHFLLGWCHFLLGWCTSCSVGALETSAPPKVHP